MQKNSYYLKEFFIPIYNYTVYFFDFSNSTYADVVKLLTKHKFEYTELEEIKANLNRESINGAITIHALGERKIYVVMYKHTNIEEWFCTINHELYHVVNDILNYLGIKDDESGAYLYGYISKEFYKNGLYEYQIQETSSGGENS